MTRAHERLRYRSLCVAVVVFPLVLLLAVNDVFYLDWLNHVWMVSYYSDVFRAHRTFPDVIHATQAVGLAHPIFYAHFFYAFTGLLGTFLGPDLAIRMIIFALMAAQFHAVFRLFESFTWWSSSRCGLRSGRREHSTGSATHRLFRSSGTG